MAIIGGFVMDEFKKPYEYEEERIGGFLLFFVILLLSVDSFFTLSLVVQGFSIANRIPAAGIVFLIFGIVYGLFLFYTAATCYRAKTHMIKLSKAFLCIRAFFTLFLMTMIYLNALGDKGMIGNGRSQYQSVEELTLIVFVLPAIYTILFSTGWFIYFIKSKKCADMVKASSSQTSLPKVWVK